MWARIGSGFALAAVQVAIYFTSGPYGLLASVCVCACTAVVRNARDARSSGIRNVCMHSAAVAALVVFTAWSVYSLRIGKMGGTGFLIVLSMGLTLMLMGHRFLLFSGSEKSPAEDTDMSAGRRV
jgi:hypothetical protein